MLGCKDVDNLSRQNKKLEERSESPLVDKGRFQQLVVRLIYLLHTCLDIAYVVTVESQFMHSPQELHMEAVYKILQYLKSSPGKGLWLARHDYLNL
jgi:hypothetical protein